VKGEIEDTGYPLPVQPVYAATASCEDGSPPLRRRLSDQTVLRPSGECPNCVCHSRVINTERVNKHLMNVIRLVNSL
jgi:hypothetical protein